MNNKIISINKIFNIKRDNEEYDGYYIELGDNNFIRICISNFQSCCEDYGREG